MVCVSSNPPYLNSRDQHYMTLEVTWFEYDIEMRMFIYLYSDGKRWWSNEIRVYNGQPYPNSDWVYFYGKFFDTPVGQAFTQSDQFAISAPDSKTNNAPVTLSFSNVKFAAFLNYFKQTTPTPTPLLTLTPTPPPAGRLSFTLSDTNGAPVRKGVKIFAKSADQNEFVLLGQTETNSNGAGDIWIENIYLNKPWSLYAQTSSHLLRLMNSNIFPIWFSPGKTVDVKFDKLIPGDIYITEGQNRQDGVINNFDVATLYAAWVDIRTQTGGEKTGFGALLDPQITGPADLNADGVVNNRDLAILFSNFGKQGDNPNSQKTPPPLTPQYCKKSSHSPSLYLFYLLPREYLRQNYLCKPKNPNSNWVKRLPWPSFFPVVRAPWEPILF